MDTVEETANNSQSACGRFSNRYTFRQYVTIFSYIYGNFFLAACVSLQAPFFPKEAESKGASATEYGLVFGAYEIAIIAVSPIVGKLVAKMSPQILIQSGLILTGVATIVFGFLDRLPAGAMFISFAFVIRIVEGIGASSFTTPSYAATADEFSTDQAAILSLLETSFGLGLIFGPTMGGWLYELGGYCLPFFALGFCLFVGAILNLSATYKCKSTDNSDTSRQPLMIESDKRRSSINFGNSCSMTTPRRLSFSAPSRKASLLATMSINQATKTTAAIHEADPSACVTEVKYLDILLTPGVLIYAYSIVTCLTVIGFNAATLEPHLRPFELSVVVVGSIFVINGSIYAVCAPIGGWLCNKFSTFHLLAIGTLVSLGGLLFIGPIPMIDIDTKLSVIISSLVALGLGGSVKLLASLVGTFKYAVKDLNMPDNKATFGVCSSIYHTATSIGALLGPAMGGYLLDEFGYQNATYFFVLLELLLFVSTIWFIFWRKCVPLQVAD